MAVKSVTLFLVALKIILAELENGVDGLFFANDLDIHITTRNQRMAIRALQGITNKLNAWAVKRGLTFSTSRTEEREMRK